MKNRFLLLSLALICSAILFAEAVQPSVTLTTYYAGADGKKGEALRTALREAIDHHSNITYAKIGYLMKYADTKNAAGEELIDIYSDCPYSTSTVNNKGNYDIGYDRVNWIASGNVGDGLNREHTVPQSWFNKADPMVADAFHIYPTDAKANNHRSSYLYGEIYPKNSGETLTGTMNSETVHELGALGNTYSQAADLAASKYTYDGVEYTLETYNGLVYEPADEYKGDLARGIFYMATRYDNPDTNDGTDCTTWKHKSNPTHFDTDNTGSFGLSKYTVALLLKWHRQDPVSEKERLRNEVIYGNPKYNPSSYKQGNRNPFIDYPCLVEYIWGNRAGETVDISKLTSSYATAFTPATQGCDCATPKPAIYVSFASHDFGTVIKDNEASVTLTVNYADLQNGIGAQILESWSSKPIMFTASAGGNTITTSGGSIHDLADGATGSLDITISYKPTAVGAHKTRLNIWTGSTSQTIALSGSCGKVRLVKWFVDGQLVQTEQVADGSKVSTLPDAPAVPANCSGKKFVGWARYEETTPTNTPPATLFTSVAGAPTVNDDYAWYYAVFADNDDTNFLTRCTPFYTVTFDDGNGYTTDIDFREGSLPEYPYGEPYKSSTPEYEYEFLEWSPALAPVTEDATYTAQYTASKVYYEVTFHLDAFQSSDLVAYGEKATRPADPEPSCRKHFDNWYSYIDPADPANNVLFDFDNTTITDRLDIWGLYAWDAASFDIPYILNYEYMYHGEFVHAADTLLATNIVPSDGMTEIPLAFKSITGYNKPAMTSWAIDICADTAKDIPSAFYEPIQHQVTWITDGDPLSGIIDFTQDLYYGYAQAYPAPNTPTKPNHVFAGWSPAKYAWMPNDDVTHTATFVPARTLTIETHNGPAGPTDNDLLKGLNIQFDAEGAYSWNAATGEGLFQKNKHVKVTVNVAPGYFLYGIEDNDQSINYIEFDMPADEDVTIKVYAALATTTYTVKVETNNNALGSVDLTGAIYIDASNFTDANKWTFNASPLPNIDFVAWICPALLNNGKTEQDLIDELDDEQVKWMSYWYDGIHPDEQVQLMMDLFNTLRNQTIYNLTGTNLLELIKAGLLVPNDNDELVLRAVFRDPNATDLQMSNIKCQMPNKIIRDNRLLILLPNGKTYNATGQRLE